MTVLQLISGGDEYSPPQTPTDSLDLAEFGGYIDHNCFLPYDGFSPASGDSDYTWSGLTSQRAGQRLYDEKVDNAKVPLKFNLRGDTTGQLEWLRSQVQQYISRAKLYEKRGVGEPIWIRHRWTPEALRGKPEPVVGQWSRYWRVIAGGPLRWPRDVHSSLLHGGHVPATEAELVLSPFAYGRNQRLGHADGLAVSGSDVSFHYDIAAGVISGTTWTLAGWMKYPANADFWPFELYGGSSNWLLAMYDYSESRWEFQYPSYYVPAGSTVAHNIGDDIHVVVVATGSAIKFYVNGTLYINFTTTPLVDLTGGFSLFLGSKYSAASTAYTNGLDGWRMWQNEFSASEIAALYADELPTKLSGGEIGRPPYLKTLGGFGAFDNVDGVLSSAAKDNWGVAHWLPGDVSPVVTDIELPQGSFGPSTAYGFYLGVQPDHETLTPSQQHWVDFSGTTDTGNSSGDAYNSESSSSNSTKVLTLTSQDMIEHLHGRYRLLARMTITTAAQTVDVTPFIQFDDGNTAILFDTRTISTQANMQLYDLGDVVLSRWRNNPPKKLTWGLLIVRGGVTKVINLDWLLLLPNPVSMPLIGSASITVAAGHTVVIRPQERQVEVRDGSGYIERRLSYIGRDIDLLPGFYNYIWLVLGRDATQFYPAATPANGASQWYITPRWATSGPPVA